MGAEKKGSNKGMAFEIENSAIEIIRKLTYQVNKQDDYNAGIADKALHLDEIVLDLEEARTLLFYIKDLMKNKKKEDINMGDHISNKTAKGRRRTVQNISDD